MDLNMKVIEWKALNKNRIENIYPEEKDYDRARRRVTSSLSAITDVEKLIRRCKAFFEVWPGDEKLKKTLVGILLNAGFTGEEVATIMGVKLDS